MNLSKLKVAHFDLYFSGASDNQLLTFSPHMLNKYFNETLDVGREKSENKLKMLHEIFVWVC